MKEKRGLLLAIIIVIMAIALAFILKKVDEGQINEKNQARVKEKDINTKGIERESKTPDKAEIDGGTDKTSEAKAGEDKTTEKLPDPYDDFYIADEAIFHKVMDEQKPLMLMFGTPDCIYCRQMKPMMERFSQDYKDQVNIKYLDAYDYPDLAYQFPIRGVPAFLYRTSDKRAYSPSKELKDLLSAINSLTTFTSPNSDKNDITMSYGLMEETTVKKIIKELVDNVK